MTYIEYPENKAKAFDVPFFLATEEFVARRLSRLGDCLFMWQVEASAIFGRHQNIEAEVNLDYCHEHAVRTFRRKSGGGCVYADMGNIMVSYITDGENIPFIYNRYINMLVLALHKIGIKATTTQRNDILVEGKKVSGNAFYHLPGRSIVHGTLLYDTDMQNMVSSITPSAEKLAKNGVQSVRQRIGLLKDRTNLTISEIKTEIRQLLCADEHYTLTDSDLKEIEEIRQSYLDERFIYGKG